MPSQSQSGSGTPSASSSANRRYPIAVPCGERPVNRPVQDHQGIPGAAVVQIPPRRKHVHHITALNLRTQRWTATPFSSNLECTRHEPTSPYRICNASPIHVAPSLIQSHRRTGPRAQSSFPKRAHELVCGHEVRAVREGSKPGGWGQSCSPFEIFIRSPPDASLRSQWLRTQNIQH